MPRTDKLKRYHQKRDFRKTAEPEGDVPSGRGDALAFVIQKHAASHLHYDLRLELEGVMKSWAVPKGPSADPAVKRLAMEVEDHPIAYNDFEGTIPKGEYGGGTVMIWDRGGYAPTDAKPGEAPEKAVRRGYHQGHLRFRFMGERLRGEYHLIRKETSEGGRASWLLVKAKDDQAGGREPTTAFTTSVVTGRSMEEIAAGRGGKRVWRSNRGAGAKPRSASRAGGGRKPKAEPLRPMLPSPAKARPRSGRWTFEPAFRGLRVLAYGTSTGAALMDARGRDRADAFPEVAAAVRALVTEMGRPVVLDGVVVTGPATGGEAALIAFDLLLEGEQVLAERPWSERRARLEKMLLAGAAGAVRLGGTSEDLETVRAEARGAGWAGVVAKRIDAPYRAGARSRDWREIPLRG